MDEERGGEGALVSDNGETERTPEQVRAEIEQTRQELGETVEALAAKTDIKGQARQAVNDARATVDEKVAEVKHSVGGTAESLTASGRRATPRTVSEAGIQASRFIRENRPAVIAVGALTLGILIGRRRRSRG